MAQLYICTQTSVSNRHGRETWITPGQVAEAGSWVLDVSPRSFRLLAVDYPAPGSDLAEQKPEQHHPAAEKSEAKVEAAKAEPQHERKAAAHKPARKG